MLKGGRITLLIIPEEGSKTLEFKLPRIAVAFFGLVGAGVLFLLGLGYVSYERANDLANSVVLLQREKALFEQEIGQIKRLEATLLGLTKSNRQLLSILGESPSVGPITPRRSGEEYVSSIERLEWGNIASVPSLWPINGSVVHHFNPEFGGVLIAARQRALVRASAAGTVVDNRFDEKLGHLVVIDHGSGIQSAYGYNAAPLVDVNEVVQKGQAIALSGKSGNAWVPGLYYAVRENGIARDPLKFRLWL
jgi:murein DD-endopeptidase MepM/ murein hydrolase activator NlpD